MNQPKTQPKLNTQDFIMSQLSSSDMPNNLFSIPHLARLNHLIIKNFKSFKQETFTGPFLGFTSIVGPNGSGKSNVLDALMFCLCGQNLKQNFFDLREYINREKTQSYKEMSKKKKVCSVTAVFTLENGRSLQLKRQLDPQSNESYYIDNEDVSKKVYENFLFSQGINPHIPNYAITQGEIDKLLLKEPNELAKYIENLSGSFLFKRQYDSTKQEISQIRKNIVSMGQKIIKLKNDKKNAKNLSQASKQCQQLQKQYEQIVNRLFLAKTYIREIQLNQYEQQINKKKNEQKLRIQEINKRKLKIQQELKQKQDLNKEINCFERKILELNSQLKTLNRPDLLIKNKQLEVQQKQLEYMQSQLKKMIEKRQKLEESLPKTHSSQVVEEYLKLYSQWQSKNREINIELQNKKTLYFNLQSQRQFQKSLLQSQLQKQKQFKFEDQKRKRDIDSAKEEISQINQVIAKLQKEIKQKEQMLRKNQTSLRDNRQQYELIENEIQNLEQLLTENVETQKDKEVIKRLCLIEGFRGLIQQKIRPKQQKYVVAFSILVSSISKYLLCKDEKSSKQVSDKLKDMNVIKTLIILSNLKKTNSNDSIKQNVGKNGISALDIIDFDSNIQGFELFLEDYCRGKVICENLSVAFQIRNKRVPGLREIITLDGEVIRNDGMITSCGNIDHVKRTYKLGSNKKSLQVQLQKSIKLRDELKQKIIKLQLETKPEEQLRRNQEVIKLERKKVDLQGKIEFLSTIKPKESKSLKNFEKDIALLTEKLNKVEKQIVNLQKNVTKDVLMTQFMKKNHIENLQSFRSASNLQVLQKQTKRKNEMIREIDQMTGKIQLVQQKIQIKTSRIRALKSDLNNISDGQNKKNIQKQIQENETKIKSLREQISKLGVFRDGDIHLRSQVIEMQTKYKFLREKFRQYMEDLKIQLGASVNSPRIKDDYKLLEDYISQGSLDRLATRKIEHAIRDLQAEKKQFQQKLQKFNSINLMSKNHQKEQSQINAQIKQLSDAVYEQSTRRGELEKKLDDLKVNRKSVFMTFFDKVKETLRQSYEILTEIQPGVAGKADLYLENSQVPFEHGIYFTPTPPTKRFIYDLEQLSGGEKSIASLALQYALAVSSRSPFLILDESDAYLDANNTGKLLKLLQESNKDKKIQIILITHKSNIFANCESLVGICRPKQEFSKVFSMMVK